MKGSAMIAAMILIVIGTLVVGGYLSYMGYESQMTKKLNDSIKAFYIAEAGLDLAIKKTFDDWDDNDPHLFRQNSISETDFGGGTYTVTEFATNITKTITSVGKYGNEMRVVNKDLHVDPDLNLADNSIASCGSTGGTITGECDIRGSVYILGEEPYVDVDGEYGFGPSDIDASGNGSIEVLGSDEYVLQMSGSSQIGNNYIGMPTDLFNLIPSIQNEDGIYTLDTEVNVKHGQIGFEGSASIGSDEIVVDYKNTMDYVGIVDDPHPPEGYIFTDVFKSGSEAMARFNPRVRLPSLKDYYRDGAGNKYFAPEDPYGAPTVEGGYESYLRVRAYNNGEHSTVIPSLTIDNSQGNITIGAPGSNYLNYSRNNSSLAISGIIFITGDLTIDRNITYTGRGTIYAQGEVNIRSDILTGPNRFPTRDILGIMTRSNINFGVGSNPSPHSDVMGLFYAENMITCAHYYNVAGALISRLFALVTNPNIYQVPAVADNLPPYFINTRFPGQGIVLDEWYESPVMKE